MNSLRPGVRLALDWGGVRIGVAACDREAIMAFPVKTVTAGEGAIGQICELVAEYEPIEVVFGLPVNLAGADGPAALAIRERAGELAAVVGVPVRLVDERLSTRAASRAMRRAGRNAKQQRGVLDQAAAVEILESALAIERATGTSAGQVVSIDDRTGDAAREHD